MNKSEDVLNVQDISTVTTGSWLNDKVRKNMLLYKSCI